MLERTVNKGLLYLWTLACQLGVPARFTAAAALVNALMEARDERR